MRLNDFQLTEHFGLIEFQCPCCHRVMLSPPLVHRLEKLRGLWNKPIIINSGYRCGSHNEAVGGAKRSAHIFGRAADVRVPRHLQEKFRELARSCGFSRTIVYPERGFIHLEI